MSADVDTAPIPTERVAPKNRPALTLLARNWGYLVDADDLDISWPSAADHEGN